MMEGLSRAEQVAVTQLYRSRQDGVLAYMARRWEVIAAPRDAQGRVVFGDWYLVRLVGAPADTAPDDIGPLNDPVIAQMAATAGNERLLAWARRKGLHPKAPRRKPFRGVVR